MISKNFKIGTLGNELNYIEPTIEELQQKGLPEYLFIEDLDPAYKELERSRNHYNSRDIFGRLFSGN
ncbi:Uncharacterised protein [uncultured archaeon]|nr:Uncharacterised protein [uncultured archaeon]